MFGGFCAAHVFLLARACFLSFVLYWLLLHVLSVSLSLSCMTNLTIRLRCKDRRKNKKKKYIYIYIMYVYPTPCGQPRHHAFMRRCLLP